MPLHRSRSHLPIYSATNSCPIDLPASALERVAEKFGWFIRHPITVRPRRCVVALNLLGRARINGWYRIVNGWQPPERVLCPKCQQCAVTVGVLTAAALEL